MSSAHEKVTRAKSKLVIKQPFFAHIVLSTPLEEAEWLNPPTMATDMKTIFYHPKFVEEHSDAEIMGVLSHEAMHIAYFHGTRRGTRDHMLWNIATDYAINLIVEDAGLSLPKDALREPKYAGWTAQAIYEDIRKNAKTVKFSFPGSKGEGPKGEGAPMWGGVLDMPGEGGGAASESERSLAENEIKIMVQAAANSAKSRGKLPGSLKGLIEAVGAPVIDWQNYIQQWVKGQRPDDYTWAKPNRRMLANHRVYMPQMVLNGAGTGVLSIDTSGSVSDEELRKYAREIAGIIEVCGPDKLHIIQHDAIVQDHRIWEAGDDFKSLSVKGRGGTCIRPVFDLVETLDDPIDWMVCLTDCGIADYPKTAPDYPVLWAATGPDNTPFGTYIKIKDHFGE